MYLFSLEFLRAGEGKAISFLTLGSLILYKSVPLFLLSISILLLNKSSLLETLLTSEKLESTSGSLTFFQKLLLLLREYY